MPTLFSDFLTALEVPHTTPYSDRRFETMAFKSLFGLSKLLEEYGVDNEALSFSDKDVLTQLTPPFLARMDDSFAIVTAMDSGGVTLKRYDGTVATPDKDSFCKDWTGVVLLAYPDAKSREPEYETHRFIDIANKAKKYVLFASALFLVGYLFVSNGLWRSPSLTAVGALDIFGLYVSFLLVLKTHGVHTGAADRMCGIIDRTGCSTVLSTKASTFFGIFGWSEVGLAYFGVSLGALLMFPQCAPWLALADACCCPFSIWSVWYQKYRAKAWCTLCLCVQATLWLLLGCFILGGWFRDVFPVRIEFFVLVASYITALLAINAVSPKEKSK